MLRDFSMFTCLDHRQNSMGIALYKNNSSAVTTTLHSPSTRPDTILQTIQCNVNNLRFCFSYIHPGSVRPGLRALIDMEVNIQQLGPSRMSKQIDHVLIPMNLFQNGVLHVVQKFTDLYSDHASIAVRFCYLT